MITVLPPLSPLDLETAPWDYDAMDVPARVIFTLFGHGFTDAFLFTFLWFGGYALLCWAVWEKVKEDDGSRPG